MNNIIKQITEVKVPTSFKNKKEYAWKKRESRYEADYHYGGHLTAIKRYLKRILMVVLGYQTDFEAWSHVYDQNKLEHERYLHYQKINELKDQK